MPSHPAAGSVFEDGGSTIDRDRLLTLLRMTPSAIAFVSGRDHVYEFANDAYLKLAGRSDILGKPAREAAPWLGAEYVWAAFDHVYATGETYEAHECPGTPDPCVPQRFFELALRPLKDSRGRPEGILIHASETTAIVEARRVAEVARQAAESAARAKDEFLAMLGHELRNPLAPILTALQLMRLRAGQTAIRERTIVERQVNHLVRLVDDLLDVSRVARGKVTLSRSIVEIADVVAEAIEMSTPLLAQHRQNLAVQVPSRGLSVDGDAGRLAQVVANLLSNAAKYTPSGGRIVVSALVDGDDVVLSVADDGIGISAEMLPRVFDLFTQDRQALDRSQGGLGLGLAIVRSFVRLHGGAVWVESAGVGKGSRFTVRLPRAQDVADATNRPGSVSDASTFDRDGQRRGRVLVVDDNIDAALMLAELLQELGCETETVHDPVAALRACETLEPELALLDIGLPVMDGYELARQLRARGCTAALVAVTGYGQDADRRRSREAGFDAHLVKPVAIDALHGVLRAVRPPARAQPPPV